MTAELFTIPETKPDPLTSARNRLQRAIEAHDESIENPQISADEATEIRRQLRLAREAVESLETEALRSR